MKPKPKTFLERAALTSTLSDIRKLCKIEEWDYILIGDGSGTSWSEHCGWASILIEEGTFAREHFYGSFSGGTNIVAEMMAYVQPLMWLAARKDRRLGPDGSTQIHVITDCEYVKNAGNKKLQRQSNTQLWHMIDVFRRSGMRVIFHWIPRDTIDANKYSHHLANLIRLASKKLDVSIPLQKVSCETIFDVNPS